MRGSVGVRTTTLANGLAVVVAEDPSAPVFGLCVLYRVGWRGEPQGRSGFAHLFEHLMFEGTPRVPKGVFDRLCEGAGGHNNGQTRPDVTLYVESAPVSALDRFLWLEADRMTALALSQEALDNQRDVVKEEIRVNVKNDPFGYFEAGELPGVLFDRWENAHDGYGDFHDLDAATLEDVRSFYEDFYRPNNAVLAVAGDVDADDVFRTAERYFASIPAAPRPERPDLHEPRRSAPALHVDVAPLAKTPALAAGWRMPEASHEDALPLLVLGELLHDGRAARLYRGLVEGREIATDVVGGFNPFQGLLWYEGATLFLSRVGFRRGVAPEAVLGAIDEEVAAIRRDGIAAAELARVVTKLTASYLFSTEPRAEHAIELAQAAAFSGDASAVAAFPGRLSAIRVSDLQRAASWLDPDARAAIVKLPPEGAA